MMENNSTYGQEISIRDWMFSVFHKWKLILIVGIVCAFLLGGYKGLSIYNSNANADVVANAQKDYELEMEVYDMTKAGFEREIADIQLDIIAQNEYLENSVLQQANPYEIAEARADIFVSTNSKNIQGQTYSNVDYAESIVQMYQSLLTRKASNKALAEATGIDSRYVEELVSVTIGGVKSDKSGALAETADEYGKSVKVQAPVVGSNRVFTICVKHNNEADAQMLLDMMLTQVDEVKVNLSSMIGEHEIHVLHSDVSSGVDLDVAEAQKAQEEKLKELNANLTETQEEMAKLVEPSAPNMSLTSAIKSGIKFAVLGGILGAFVVVFGVCILFLMNDKMYSAKEFKQRFNAKILGTLPVNGSKKICFVDAWLNRLEGRVFEKDEKLSYGLIAANARNYMDGQKTLLVTGTADADKVAEVAQKLRTEMPEIEILSGGSMLNTVETLTMLPKCEGVILVEQCNISKYGEIAQELEKAQDLGKSVVGCVVIG